MRKPGRLVLLATLLMACQHTGPVHEQAGATAGSRGTELARPFAPELAIAGNTYRASFSPDGNELYFFRRVSEVPGQEDYRIETGVVTVDNQEWVFAAVYDDALAAKDTALAARVTQAYLEHLDASFAFYEELSRALFGREIPQVLLLHSNRLNADVLGDVARTIRARGYTFVSLEEALADAAYRLPDTYVGPRGLSWLQRWASTQGRTVPDEPREPEWIRALQSSRPSRSPGAGTP